jgi:hypothetical protein
LYFCWRSDDDEKSKDLTQEEEKPELS